MSLVHEVLLYALAKKGQQPVVVAEGIDQQDGAEKLAEPLEGHGLEQLFEGAAAAGQGDDSIGIFQHSGLAGTHVLDDFQRREPLVTGFYPGQEFGNDAVDFGARRQRTLSHRAHQAMSTTAVDNGQAGPTEGLAQSFRGADIVSTKCLAGRGIHGNALNGHELYLMSNKTRHCKRTLRPGPAGVAPILAATVLALLTACGGSSVPPAEMAEGQEPYLRFCASCHGNQGQGKPPTFPPLAGSEWMELSSEALALIVLYGLRGEIEVAGRTYRGYMPPMQHISDEDIAALLGFSERAWSGREPSLDADDIARLRVAFGGRRPPLEGKEGLMQALDELP